MGIGIAGRRRHVLLFGLIAIVGALVLGVATTTAPAGNRNPESTLAVVPGLEEVTSGQNIALTATLVNHESSTFTDVNFSAPIPAGTTFVSTDCAQFQLLPVGNPTQFVCDWGHQLPSGETATVAFVLQTPASGGPSFTLSGVWSIKEGSQAGNDTFPTNQAAASLLAGDDKRKAGKYAVTACTNPAAPTAATNLEVDATNPLFTSVCIPNLPASALGIVAKISERDHAAGDPGKTQVSDICLPAPGSGCAPGYTPFQFDGLATFTFVLDSKTYGKITKVFEDGVEVSSAANADPRVVSISPPKQGKITVVVASSDNGGWDFG
jgi:uncharacterized repeat protein (TIGR01451 family)